MTEGETGRQATHARVASQKHKCKNETTFTQASEQEYLWFLPFVVDGILSLCIPKICGEGLRGGKIEDSRKEGVKYRKEQRA